MPKQLPQSPAAPYSNAPIVIALLIALIGGFLFIFPYISVVCLAALMAFLFFPLYEKFTRWMKNSGIAASATFILSIIFVLVPIAITLILTVSQLSSLAVTVTDQLSQHGSTVPDVVSGAVGGINAAIAPFNGNEAIITDQGVSEFLRTAVPAIAATVTRMLLGIVGSIPVMVILSIMYIILFVEFLINGRKILSIITRLSPFDKATTSLYLQRVGLMTNAMAKGQLLISLIISVLSAALLMILGLGDYFFLMVVVFTILNLVPLGCGIIVMPIAIIAILLGNVVPGLIVLILYILVSNLDSVIRPKIMPKGAHLSAGLTMLAAFGGITYFGLLGVVYGPIIMILIVTTIDLYLKQKRSAAVS